VPVTVDVPLRINARGGLAMTNRPLPVLVATSVEPGDSLNAYLIRDGAAGDSVVWHPTDDDLDQLIRARVTRRFRTLELQRRARLLAITKLHDSAAEDGRAVYRVEWQDLETGDAEEAVQETQIGGGGG
jgi:hypothetical protein